MNNLQEATELICDLKGSVLALDALLTAMLAGMPDAERVALAERFSFNAEVARTVLLHELISDHTIQGFERDVTRLGSVIRPR